MILNRYDLFAETVFHLECIVQHDVYSKVLKYVEENFNRSNSVSNVGGFRSQDDFDGKQELIKIIENKSKIIGNYQIETGWLNVLDNQAYNVPHRHTDHGIAATGVLYLSTSDTSINFAKENKVSSFQPKIFDMFIFPYNLIHYVLPGKSEEKRICFAFNLKGIN